MSRRSSNNPLTVAAFFDSVRGGPPPPPHPSISSSSSLARAAQQQQQKRGAAPTAGGSLEGDLMALIRNEILSKRSPQRIVEHKARALAIAFDAPLLSTTVTKSSSKSSPSSSQQQQQQPQRLSNRQSSKGSLPGEEDDDDVNVSTMEFRLYCPYSQSRIRIPVRSEYCTHVQCCDLDSWVNLFHKNRSMRDPIAPCPVCERRVTLSSLEVDEWVAKVLEVMPSTAKLVVLHRDGSYKCGDVARDLKRARCEEEIVDGGTQLSSQNDDNEEGDGRGNDLEEEDVVVVLKPPPVVKIEGSKGPPQSTYGEYSHLTTTSSSSSYPLPLREAQPETWPQEEAELGAPTEEDASAIEVPQQRPSVSAARPPPLNSTQAESTTAALQEVPPQPTVGESGAAFVVAEMDMRGGSLDGSASQSGSPTLVTPTAWRKWIPFCPTCRREVRTSSSESVFGGSVVTSLVKSEPFRCDQCGVTRSRHEWSLVRDFNLPTNTTTTTTSRSPAPTIERTVDGTIVLTHVDALSSFLAHARLFHSSIPFLYDLYGPNFVAPPSSLSPAESLVTYPSIVWVTTMALSRYELDFLEAACGRVAAGEDPYTLEGVPTLFKFRWQNNNSVTSVGGGGGSFFSQRNTNHNGANGNQQGSVATRNGFGASSGGSGGERHKGSFRIGFGSKT